MTGGNLDTSCSTLPQCPLVYGGQVCTRSTMALAELRVLEALRASNSPHSHSPPSARPLPRSSSMRNLVVNTRTLVRTVSFTARALLQSTSFRAEVAAIVALVPPGVGRGLSNFIPTFITFVLIGRLGNEALAAFSLGEAWRGLQAEKHKGVHAAPSDAVDAWMFGLAFVVWEGASSRTVSICYTVPHTGRMHPLAHSTGLNNAQKKCVSTAHGAQNAAAVRGWFLITMGAGMACSVLLAGCWAASAPLIFAIKPSVSSSVISDYSLWFIPSLPFFMVSSVVACQLGALQRPVVPFVLEVIGALIDVSLSFVFVLGAGPAFVGLGVTGAPLASLVEQAFLAPAFVYAAWRLLQGEMGGSRTLDEHRPHQDALLSSPVSVSSSPRALASSRSIGTTSPLSFRIKTIHVARITPVSDDLLPAVTSRAEGSSYGSDAATFRSAASDSPLAPEVGALRFTFRTAAVHPFSPPVLPGCATGIAVSNSILASGSSSPQAAELTRWAPAFAFATQVTHWKHFIYLFWNCFFTAALEQWQLQVRQASRFVASAFSTSPPRSHAGTGVYVRRP